MVKKLKILCSAMDSQGHVNAILGFAKILEERGHQVIMALAPGWRSAIEKHNFEFIPLKLDSTKKEESEMEEDENKVTKVEEKSNGNDTKIVDSKSENESTVTESEAKEGSEVKKDENKVSNGNEVKGDKNKVTEVKDESNDSGIVDLKSENESSIVESDAKEEKNAEPPNQTSLNTNEKEENEFNDENKTNNGSEVKDVKNKVTKVKDESNDSGIIDSKLEKESPVADSNAQEKINVEKPNNKLLNTEKDEENEVKCENKVNNGSEVKYEDNQVDKLEDKSLNDSGIADSESVSETSITASDTKDKKDNEKANKELVAIINSQLAGFRLKPMEFARNWVNRVPMWLVWYEKQFSFDDALQEVMDAVKPDMIVIDFMMRLPCLEKSSIPWAQLWSCNPIMLYKDCPPLASGFPTDSPKELWKEYRGLKDLGDKPITAYINKWLISRGVRPYAEDEIFHIGESKFLNFYTFPSVLDYNDVAPRPAKWVRMDATVREPDDQTPFVVPEKLAGKPGALIYFSLGTMGCVDLELMNRVISVCAKSPHRFIVSKGPLHEQIELPDNMWGERYVNQIAILPHVDLVITHGGNNTLTESLYFGKPVIVMPIFWDQLDNAQRVQEKGIGIRIDTYHFQDSDLLDAIEKLLKDEPLKEKLASISSTLKSSNSKETVCELIEKTVALGKSPFDEEQVKQAQSE